MVSFIHCPLQVPRSVLAIIVEQVRQLPASGRHADVNESARGQVDPGDGAELDLQQEELRQGAEHGDHGNIDDQTGVYYPYSLNQTVSAGSYRTKRARTATLNRGDRFELRTP